MLRNFLRQNKPATATKFEINKIKLLDKVYANSTKTKVYKYLTTHNLHLFADNPINLMETISTMCSDDLLHFMYVFICKIKSIETLHWIIFVLPNNFEKFFQLEVHFVLTANSNGKSMHEKKYFTALFQFMLS